MDLCRWQGSILYAAASVAVFVQKDPQGGAAGVVGEDLGAMTLDAFPVKNTEEIRARAQEARGNDAIR